MGKKSVLTPIYTVWGESLNKDAPLPEYPRPQMQRQSYLNINGRWDYAITATNEKPSNYDGEIIVPFSPEAPLSGVNRQLKPDEYLWYRKKLIIEESFLSSHTFINFGAVDQVAEVYINGIKIGTHEGGYTPFSLECTEAVHAGENELTVCVRDFSQTGDYAYGKQTLKRGGIWYTAQSGIWQTVWLESLPEVYISDIRITPLFDEHSVKLELAFGGGQTLADITVKSGDCIAVTGKTDDSGVCILDLGENFIPWDTENPYLYDVEITADRDVIHSYFGMRKFSTMQVDGHNVLALNNTPIFHTGLLDQGYWSDGYYTPPSDEAMIYDIQQMKECGFNMLRKHIKIEPMRWYYHCDRLGMLVWQDMVSGGNNYKPLVIQALPFVGIMLNDKRYGLFGRKSENGRNLFIKDCKECVKLLYNCTSIAVWVPFNEGWGQFDSAKVYDMFKSMDSTRHIDHASGWHDQKAGDFNSRHVYYKKVRFKYDGRITVLSEFGGFSMPSEGHMSSNIKFGYKIFDTKDDFMRAYRTLYEKEVIPFIESQGLSAAVYTQVSDVEDEINGLLTYDRRVNKADKDTLAEINSRLKNQLLSKWRGKP